MNCVIISGNLTRDPVSKTTQSGIPIASFGVAVNRITKKQDGSGYEVDFFDVTAWSKSAEFAIQYLKKGNKVIIKGRLQNSQWQDQNGETKRKTDIIAEQVESVGKKEDSESMAPPPSPAFAGKPDDDFDDPFKE
jgi:single-strand DNA-binding protein